MTTFEEAQDKIHNSPRPLTHLELHKLYALYKQGKFGDCNIPKPKEDEKEKLKWELWNSLRGKLMKDAQTDYIYYVNSFFD